MYYAAYLRIDFAYDSCLMCIWSLYTSPVIFLVGHFQELMDDECLGTINLTEGPVS